MKNQLLKLLFSSCFVLLSSFVFSAYSIKNNHRLNGLHSNVIYSFFKDSKGIMWIGTDAGLCRYDGINLKVFDEKDGLKNLEIWSIVEDENHHLWFSTYPNGITRYDGKKFKHFKSKFSEWEYNAVRKLVYVPKYKCLVLGTEYGLALFKENKFYFINTKKDFQTVGIDNYKNTIYITSSFKGVYKLHLDKVISNSKLDSLFYLQTSFSSFIKRDAYYCCGPDKTLITRNLKTFKTNTWKVPITWNYASDNTNVFLSTWNISDPDGGVFKLEKSKKLIKIPEVKSTQIWSMYFDVPSKKLWVGTMDKGIYVLNTNFNIDFFNPKSLNIKSLEADEFFIDRFDNLWVGSKDNLVIHSKRGNKLLDKRSLTSKINYYLSFQHQNIRDFIPAMKLKNGFIVFNIHSDSHHNVWVNTTWGVLCFDKKLNVIAFKYTNNGSHSFITQDGKVYISKIYGSIECFTNKDSLIVKSSKIYSLKDKNSPRDIVKIENDGTNAWLASNYFGVYKFQNNRFLSLLDAKIFNEQYIKDIRLSTKNELIITTKSGVVFIVSTANNQFIIKNKFKVGKEIIGTSIDFALPYGSVYFIGTNKGINIIKNNKRYQLIDRSNGLVDVQFKNAIIHKDTLWILTTSGIQRLDIKELLYNKPVSRNLIIKSIVSNGRDLMIGDNRTLALNYDQNSIQFDIKSIDLYNGRKNKYEYKIEELSSIWYTYGELEKFQLNGLAPGKYHLSVKGANLNTGNYFKPLRLLIVIKPPFWNTIWFYCLISTVIFIITYYLLNLRIKRIRKFEKEKTELNNQLNETKIEALRAQMNPHFIFNAMNSIQNYIIDNDAKNAMYYLSEFSRLIRHTLENATEKFTTIELELKFLHNYLNVQKMRFGDINTSIKISSEIDTYSELIPPLIIQPFIENAFEHAFDASVENQKIEIAFFIENGLLFCKISDNGIGITNAIKNKLHKSISSEIVLKRLNLLNVEMQTNDFSLIIGDNEDNTGTIALITFKRMNLNDALDN